MGSGTLNDDDEEGDSETNDSSDDWDSAIGLDTTTTAKDEQHHQKVYIKISMTRGNRRSRGSCLENCYTNLV